LGGSRKFSIAALDLKWEALNQTGRFPRSRNRPKRIAVLIKAVTELASTALFVATLPGSGEIALTTLGAILPSSAPVNSSMERPGSRCGKLAVVIPAHNESATILRCLQSLRNCEPLSGEREVSLVVVADNCTDDTANIARQAGAITMVRTDRERIGKGFALQDTFEELLAQDFDAFVIVDADTVVERNFIVEIARMLDAGADAVQTRYLALNAEASLPSRLASIALMAFNVVRPRGRDRLRLSAGVLGNGFALPRRTLQAVPYSASSIVEDLEYHLRLIESGKRVAFADRTTVRAEMPVTALAMAMQRSRWEGGRLRMLVLNAIPLGRALTRGNVRAFEPLLELMTLPLSFHVSMLAVLLVIGSPVFRIYSLVALVVIFVQVVVAVIVTGGKLDDLATLLAAPFYIAWKLMLSANIFRFARKDAKWVRTERSEVAPDTQS
jgi:cellulose synthase/poly-beta-1,6-N-acetylglucosamine synthase-like glycosyltransferase